MAPALPNFSVLSSSLFSLFYYFAELNLNWLKKFLRCLLLAGSPSVLGMSAECLLGALLADLLISVVLFCQSLFGESVDVYLDWAQVFFLPMFLVIFNQCLLDVSLYQPNILLACVCLFLSIFVVRNLLMSIWTELACFSFQYLSRELNWCLPEVFPNVFCQVCLKVSLDVFLDQPNIFLASVCPMGLISVCPSWFSPVSFCQCLLWGTCWCLLGLNSRVFLPVSF